MQKKGTKYFNIINNKIKKKKKKKEKKRKINDKNYIIH